MRSILGGLNQRWFLAGMIIATAAIFSLVATPMEGANLPAGEAANLPTSLPNSDFEIDYDANLKVDHLAGTLDWENVEEASQDDELSGSADDSFGKGTKEDTAVPEPVTGSIPPNKSDLKTFGVYLEDNGTDRFMHLFWTRVQDPNGTTNLDFEFNQSSVISSNRVTPIRTDGDLLIEYKLTKGGTEPKLYRYTWIDVGGTLTVGDCEASSSLPCWGGRTDLTASGDAAGSINTSAIAAENSDGLGALGPYTFGEASVDLAAIFDDTKCQSFGSAYLKSRSSDSFTSAVKDFILPQRVDIKNCGTVIIHKVTDPPGALDFSGNPISFGFTSNIATDPVGDSTFSVVHGKPKIFSNNVLAGESYWVTEDNTDNLDYELTSIDCGGSVSSDKIFLDDRKINFDISVGETVHCTFTNTLKPKLTVAIVLINDDGGLANESEFAVEVEATDLSLTTIFGGQSITMILDEGEFNVAESLETRPPSGYQVSYDGCSGYLSPGDNQICTVTYNDVAPTLKLIKEVTNDDGGKAAEKEWMLSAEWSFGEGDATRDFSNPGDSDIFEMVFANAGYDLSESVDPSGYTAGSWDCDGRTLPGSTITLGLDEHVTCTLINNDIAPTLKLVKTMTNDDGGKAEPKEWTLSAANSGEEGSSRDFSNAGGSGVSQTVFANNSYVLSESGGPSGYTAGSWSCDGRTLPDSTITLGLDEHVTCTLINNDIAPTLKLVKTMINDDGGKAEPKEWTLSAANSGEEGSSRDFSNAGGSGVSQTVFANNSYVLSESGGPSGYSAGSWTCDGVILSGSTITLGLNEDVTCTINNDDIAPTLKLVKTVIKDDGGVAAADDWRLSADASSPNDGRNFSNAGGSGVSEMVFANAGYDLSESGGPSGYSAGSWTCDGVTLAGSTITLGLDEVVTCTIINDDVAPTLTIHKTDDADPAIPVGGATFTLWEDNDPTDGHTSHHPSLDTQTDLSCTTDASGDCTISGIHLGDYWVVESFTPEGYDTAADQRIVLVAGAEETLTFVNPRQFTMIVLICETSTNRLYASAVMLPNAGGVVTTSLDPNALVDLGITDAQLCNLAGARYEYLNFGPYTMTVDIPQ